MRRHARSGGLPGFPGAGNREHRPNCQKAVSACVDPAGHCLVERGVVLLFVSAVKLIAEIALMALLGQWLLGLLAGAKRDSNFFYKLLQVLTQPFVRVARWISPRIVLDRHIPLVAFLLLAFGWLAATLAKIDLCLKIGVEACR